MTIVNQASFATSTQEINEQGMTLDGVGFTSTVIGSNKKTIGSFVLAYKEFFIAFKNGKRRDDSSR